MFAATWTRLASRELCLACLQMHGNAIANRGVGPDLKGSPRTPAQSEFQCLTQVAHLLKPVPVHPATPDRNGAASPLLFLQQ